MVETKECKECQTLNEVKVSTGHNKPENKGRKYFTCIKCNQFQWVESVSEFVRPPQLPPQEKPPVLRQPDSVTPVSTGAGFSKDEIDRGLKELPAKLARAAEVFNHKLEEVELKKLQLKVVQAVSTTEHSKKELNATEKQALVTQDTQDAEVDVIKAETAMRVSKIDFEKHDNYFTAVRKAASLLAIEMSAFGSNE